MTDIIKIAADIALILLGLSAVVSSFFVFKNWEKITKFSISTKGLSAEFAQKGVSLADESDDGAGRVSPMMLDNVRAEMNYFVSDKTSGFFKNIDKKEIYISFCIGDSLSNFGIYHGDMIMSREINMKESVSIGDVVIVGVDELNGSQSEKLRVFGGFSDNKEIFYAYKDICDGQKLDVRSYENSKLLRVVSHKIPSVKPSNHIIEKITPTKITLEKQNRRIPS